MESVYILRAVFDDVPSWSLYDAGKFLRPGGAAKFDVDSPGAMLDLWEGRKWIELSEAGPPQSYLPPLPVRRIFCPAVNFRSHGKESGMSELAEPYFFLKFSSSAVPHGGSVAIPPQVKKADYEGEIGLVIGRRGKHWSKEEAEDSVFGYTVVNDLSLRDYQFKEAPRYGKNWVMGKAFDGSLPIGPWILPKEETTGFRFTIETKVNSEVKQSGSTEDMIFSPGELISYLSEVNTLEPGDVITTGTPSGVAAHGDRKYLTDGDKVEIHVSGIGTLVHHITLER